jgi:hypothetical protein
LNRDETVIADQLSDVTILFADLIGFTKLSSQMSARELARRAGPDTSVTVCNRRTAGFEQFCYPPRLPRAEAGVVMVVDQEADARPALYGLRRPQPEGRGGRSPIVFSMT